MRMTLMVFIFLTEALLCFGQKQPLIMDKMYYLLGTIDECSGRQTEGVTDTTVDRYYPNEGVIMGVIDTFFNKDYSDLKGRVKLSGHKILSSRGLSEKVNKYYVFEDRGTLRKNEEQEETYVLDGKLKEGIFETNRQKCSYLAGVFTRYGNIENGIFVIRLASTGNKEEICMNLLEELGCTDVQYEKAQTPPRSNKITFTPVGELREYLQKAMDLRKYMPDKWAKPDKYSEL